jgi:hypothetical protein
MIKIGTTEYSDIKIGPNEVSKIFRGEDLVWERNTPKTTLYVGGSFTTYKGSRSNRIISLNLDGSVNTDFDIGTGFSSNNYCVYQYKDKLYIGGIFTSYNGTSSNRIISLNLDGSINTDFNIGTGFSSAVVFSIFIYNDKVYIGGGFTSYNGTTSNRIISLNLDGSVNTDFDIGTGFNQTVNTVS